MYFLLSGKMLDKTIGFRVFFFNFQIIIQMRVDLISRYEYFILVVSNSIKILQVRYFYFLLLIFPKGKNLHLQRETGGRFFFSSQDFFFFGSKQEFSTILASNADRRSEFSGTFDVSLHSTHNYTLYYHLLNT